MKQTLETKVKKAAQNMDKPKRELKTRLVSAIMFILGLAILIVDLLDFQLHALAASIGVAFTMCGALLIEPAEMTVAFNTIVDAARKLLPWTNK